MIEDFLQRFPYWPRSLAESFGDLLGLALPESDIYARAKNFYHENLYSPIVERYLITSQPAWNQSYAVNFLDPTNAQYARTLSVEQPYIEIPIDYAVFNSLDKATLDAWRASGLRVNEYWPTANSSWRGRMRPYVVTRYDIRLVSSVSNSIDYEFKPDGYKFQYSYLDVMSYSHQEVHSGKSYILAKAKASISNFVGVESILALHENGKSFPDLSIANLYEFSTYLQAYEKNLSQISATVGNSEAAARDALTKYSRELQTQIDIEARNLENLEINLKNQAQAEAFAVSRDIANLIVSAQGVALQISERLP